MYLRGHYKLMAGPLEVYDQVEVVLIPIVSNGLFHLLVLDKEKEYQHSSSLENKKYDIAVEEMVLFIKNFMFSFIFN